MNEVNANNYLRFFLSSKNCTQQGCATRGGHKERKWQKNNYDPVDSLFTSSMLVPVAPLTERWTPPFQKTFFQKTFGRICSKLFNICIEKGQNKTPNYLYLKTTVVKMATQPKRSVLLEFLAEIVMRHQDKMSACSFEIISFGYFSSLN